MSRKKTIPPLKRDWKPGQWQLGLFARTPQGSVIEVVRQDAPEEIWDELFKLFIRKDGDDA